MPERKPDRTLTVYGPSRITIDQKTTIEISFTRHNRPILKFWLDGKKRRVVHLDRMDTTCKTDN